MQSIVPPKMAPAERVCPGTLEIAKRTNVAKSAGCKMDMYQIGTISPLYWRFFDARCRDPSQSRRARRASFGLFPASRGSVASLTSARRAALVPVTTAFPVSHRLDSLNVSANLAPIVIDPDLERERSRLLRFGALQNIDNRVWFFNVIH